uniref:(northern house mosquito) hypothetical protein n=1 Tax=Culex pipiens TaxID=7175 RepID=A0A8D8FBJ5_CULPI
MAQSAQSVRGSGIFLRSNERCHVARDSPRLEGHLHGAARTHWRRQSVAGHGRWNGRYRVPVSQVFEQSTARRRAAEPRDRIGHQPEHAGRRAGKVQESGNST